MRIEREGISLEICDGCGHKILPLRDGKFLMGPYRFTRKGDKKVYCSRTCRDGVARRDYGACQGCGESLRGKRKGTLYCSNTCRMRNAKQKVSDAA